MFFVVVAVIVMPFLITAYVLDRRDRRRGHRIADARDIGRAARDARSDARAVDAVGASATGGVSWMAQHRRRR